MEADPLELLLADGIVDEVLGRLKSGKEADVWLVRHNGAVVAAKIYKERDRRNFKNDSGYKEGRTVRNTRTARAMAKGSRFGQKAAEEAWKSAEADALFKLHAGGVKVPTPVLFYEGVLLMELVLDTEGHPAPRLIDAEITREHAGPLYEFLRAEIVKMLAADVIHGDLSPYNVLIGPEGPVIIDFPQMISAAQNSQSEFYFRRDVENLRNFFAPYDPAVKARESDAYEIWRAYVRRELSADFVPSGRIDRPPPGPSTPEERKPPARGGGPRPVIRVEGGTRPPRPAGPRGPRPEGGGQAPRIEARQGGGRGGGQQQATGAGGPGAHDGRRQGGGGGAEGRPHGGERGPGGGARDQGLHAGAGGPRESRGPGGGPRESRAPGGGPRESRGPGGGPREARGPGGGPREGRGPGGGPRESRGPGAAAFDARQQGGGAREGRGPGGRGGGAPVSGGAGPRPAPVAREPAPGVERSFDRVAGAQQGRPATSASPAAPGDAGRKRRRRRRGRGGAGGGPGAPKPPSP